MLTWSGRWAASLDNEEFTQLKARNKKEALKEIKEMYSAEEMENVLIGRAYRYDPHIHANDIISELKGQWFYEFTKNSDGAVKCGKMIYDNEKVSPEKLFLGGMNEALRSDLEGRLNKELRNWIKFHKLAFNMFVVKESERINLNKAGD